MPKHKTKGPLTLKGLQGAAAPKQAYRSEAAISLRVIMRDSATSGRGLSALLHPASLLLQEACADGATPNSASPNSATPSSDSLFLDGATPDSASLFLALASGSDCVLHTRPSAEVEQGCIHVDEVQAANLRLCAGERYSFSIFVPRNNAAGDDEAADDGQQAAAGVSEESESELDDAGGDDAAAAEPPFELTDVDVEVRLHPSAAASGGGSGGGSKGVQATVDARLLLQAFCKQCCGRVLATNEYVVVDLPGVPPLLLRVTSTNSLSHEEQQEVLAYHCFRGMCMPDTQVYFHAAAAQQPADADEAAAAAAQQQQQQQTGQPPVQSRIAAGGGCVQLLHASQRPPAACPTTLVHVATSDDEMFPVRKKLLRPCIALTKAVRDSGVSCPSVAVNIDTLTFDRVLIYLEAYALKRKPPRFAVHLLQDLLQAAHELSLRPLEQYCQSLLGDKAAALQVYSFADIQRANASGKAWLLLDGMVLDVTRWLPEHPGGATIIPAQGLNCDCSRFFELYHASRESFLYLQEFYIGELLPSEGAAVPMGGGTQAPSAEFMQQLREFSPWRHEMQQRAAEADKLGRSFTSF